MIPSVSPNALPPYIWALDSNKAFFFSFFASMDLRIDPRVEASNASVMANLPIRGNPQWNTRRLEISNLL